MLTRNLHEVFGEGDPARRRAAIDDIFTEDCVFYEPRGVHRGRAEVDRIAGAIRATHPDFQYTPTAEPEEFTPIVSGLIERPVDCGDWFGSVSTRGTGEVEKLLPGDVALFGQRPAR